MENELEKAHKDYLKRKHEMLSKIYTMKNTGSMPVVYCKWLAQIEEFIKEREI